MIGQRVFGLLLVVLVAIWSSGTVRAETVAATSTAVGQSVISGTYPYTADNLVQSCNNLGRGGYPDCSSIGQPDYFRASDNYRMCGSKQFSTCYFTARANAIICPSGYAAQASNLTCVNTVIVYSCPSSGGWTLSGSSCTRPDCPSGATRDAGGQCLCALGFDLLNGVCVKDCTAKQGMATANGNYVAAGSGYQANIGGCLANCSTRAYIVATPGGIVDSSNMSDCKFTGASAPVEMAEAEAVADPYRNKTPTKTDCAAMGQGYIESSTGIVTCVESVDAPEGQKPVIVETKTTNEGPTKADGSPDLAAPESKSVETTSTSGSGETSTTTKTTENPDTVKNGTANGGCASGATLVDGKCVTSVTTTEKTSDFCTKNPNAEACGGSKSECEKNPDTAGCVELGTPSDTDTVGASPVGVGSISPVSVGSSGSCPSDVTLPKGQVFSWGPACDFAAKLRPILIALAWLSAGFIVLGFTGAKS